MKNIGIIGGSGLTGKELIKILVKHKQVKISYVTSRQYAGKKVSEVFPELNLVTKLKFIDANDKSIYKNCDLVFVCLPHTTAMNFVKKLNDKGIKVVDLSADYRIKNTKIYKKYYATEHKYKTLLKKAVYGMPEIYKKEVTTASVVGNSGCHAAAMLYGIVPALKTLQITDIMVDSKTGISGAGIAPSKVTHFLNINENVTPYKIGRSHRHLGEVEEVLYKVTGKKAKITFVPQLISAERGIMCTAFIKLKKWIEPSLVVKKYKAFYKDSPFIRFTETISLHNVQNTNFCDVQIDGVKETNTLIINTTLDNMVKGASGQAVQNMNLMLGFDEKEGLL